MSEFVWKERRFGPCDAESLWWFLRLLRLECYNLAGVRGWQEIRRHEDPVTAETVFRWRVAAEREA
jgi:hypothetical protein